MKLLFLSLLLAVTSVVSIVLWRQNSGLREEILRLNTDLSALSAERDEANAARAREARDLQELKKQLTDYQRLRGEVRQLKTAASDAEKLKRQLEQARQQPAERDVTTFPIDLANSVNIDKFPRDSWTFAGYATPADALVSTVWAMKEGNPKTYFESCSAEEQQRMLKVWGNKSEEEIAAKHKNDVAKISGIQILSRTQVSAEESQLQVFVQGVDRVEKANLKKVGNDWKFDGFVRGERPKP